MFRVPTPPRKIPTLRQATTSAFSLTSLFVFLCVLYRRYWLDADDPFKCHALLTRGHWLDPPSEPYLTRPFRQWQPPGCMMHDYTGKDIQKCLGGQRILFVGDSTTRQLFWATAKKLNATAADEEMREVGKHEDLVFEEGDVTVDFIWDPFLNSSSLRRELLSYLDDNLQPDEDTVGKASLVTVGGGLWYARHFQSDWMHQFRDSIDYLAPLLGFKGGKKPGLYSSPSRRKGENPHHIYVTPVEIPYYDVLSPSRASSMTPNKINPMNEYLYNSSITKGLKVAWSYSLMTWESEYAYEESGLHVIENVSSRRVDVLLNMRCNDQLTLAQGYPFDKTCCSAYEMGSSSAMRLFLVSILAASVIIALWAKYLQRDHIIFSDGLIRACGILAFTLIYCFLADRTQLFNKSQKHFDHQEFLAYGVAVFALGVLSIRRSTGKQLPGRQPSVQEQAVDQPFLSRDQTDEWKGWMQFVILIYHYTGASKVLWVYQLIRILVASYLFMTGFGHTAFFLGKQDYSLKRSASVLVRLNLLSCLLPYVMGTDYLFYYFAPLVSFWYMVVYLTTRVGQSHNASTPFLLSKIGVSAVMVNFLVNSSTVWERAFFLLEHTCRIKWHVKEWRFRLQLDSYIVYVGMLAAVLYLRISNVLNTQRFPSHDGIGLFRRHWRKVRIISILLAWVILSGCWIFAARFTDKFAYNRWVPYISPFPIVSFIILRNSNRFLRNYYSSIFAWLGRCSLETFTLQFHIWLAADTKGLLSLGIFGRKKTHIEGRRHDMIILAVVFLYLSWLTADATGTITNWIIDPKGAKRPHTATSWNIPMVKGYGEISLEGEFNGRRRYGNMFGKPARRLYDLWMEKLAIRLIIILLLMWIANMLKI
ncbi:MAG: hypothetical protein Q9170_001938 [Blastenia crenularia]